MFGFYRIATCTPVCHVADTTFNTEQILDLARRAAREKASVAIFPELSVTSATCADLFFDSTLLANAEKAIEKLLGKLPEQTIFVIGSPVPANGRLYDAALVIQNHQILAIVPKVALGDFKNALQKRWFASGANCDDSTLSYAGQKDIPFGTNLLIQADNYLKMAIELGKDCELPIPPSTQVVLGGATLVAIPAASIDFADSACQRLTALSAQSRRLTAACAFASSGVFESTTDSVYGGHQIVAEFGDILLDSPRFQRESIINFTDIDLQRLASLRFGDTSFRDSTDTLPASTICIVEAAQVPAITDCRRTFALHPFIADTPEKRDMESQEVFSVQAAGLAKRIEHAHSQKLVLGISGGLDSTLALLVSIEALRILGHAASDLITVTMPGFGTTDRTYNNAVSLCKALKTTLREISIKDACIGHFKDIGHDLSNRNVVYENAQARERTQILLDIANQVNGLAVGTGDLSEAAMGWCTFNGDHISQYAVNCSVPKTLIPQIITWVGRRFSKRIQGFLQDVIDTPVSPELLPADASGNIQQKTEDIIGPYEVHDFFLYHFMTYGASPDKLLFLAAKTFTDIPEKRLKLFLKGFLRRFFTQQFKRSCCPDGPMATPIALSPRGALALPSDAVVDEWLKGLE
ncbi:MAG: NAD(+) synthase [Victivallales bacterium]|nr:NAD(+) synthase [Victivallales bacterium]